MQISLQKSEVPIIWLDTFFVIEYGKIVVGDREVERYRIFYDLLREKIYQGKINCVRAAQEEELEDNIDISMKKFLSLTRGSRFVDSSEVCKIQSTRMMKAYYNKWERFDILQTDALKVSNNANDDLIINVYSIPEEEALLNRRVVEESNIKEVQDLKDNHHSESVFNEILEDEYKGVYTATTSLLGRVAILKSIFEKEIEVDIDREVLNELIGIVCGPFEEWYKVTGRELDITGFLEFLISKEHRVIPHIDISAHLIADIMASTKKLDSGGLKDINNLSSFLPYCNFILTDKSQHNRLKRHGLDKKYDTQVFCMRNINELIEKVSNI